MADDEAHRSFLRAARNGELGDMQRLLPQNGFSVDVADESGLTALMRASKRGHIEIIQYLLQEKANIEAMDKWQRTALMLAARYGQGDVVMLLLDRGAIIEATDENNRTALIIAAQYGHVDVVQLLLDRQASIEATKSDGKTALLAAARENCVDVIRLLLDRGANIAATDQHHRTALKIANKYGHVEAASALQDWDVSTNATHDGDQNASVTPELLDQVELLCGRMHGAQALCDHIHSRLSYFAEQLSSWSFIDNEAIQKKYADILDRFHGFLSQYGGKRIVTRVVSRRALVSVCQELHEQIDDLIKLCYVDSLGDCLEWKAQFASDREIQRGLLKTALEENHLLENDLQDEDAQREALTLMLFELNNRVGQYDPDELNLINRIFQNVARYSKLGIPSIPSWFIPPHDVKLNAPIGKGSYSSVRSGYWTDAPVAVKSITFHHNVHNREMFLKEVDIWSSLQHPHIVKLFGACHVGNPFFVCEYASNGNLPDYLYHPENHHKTWKCLFEAAIGLRFLHSKKVVHLDIKGDNILVSGNGVAKLTDFGLSCLVADLPPTGNPANVGAVRWKAPEFISGECSGSFACDVYSFGMTIIEVVTKRFPWGMMEDATVRYKVQKQCELPRQPAEMNDAQWDLIKRMCSAIPSDRIDMETAVQGLKGFAHDELCNHLQREWDNHTLKQKPSQERL